MWDVAVVFGLPLLIVGMSFGYAAYTRYLRHKERMAMIEKGIAPPQRHDDDEEDSGWARKEKASPITITLIGIAITIGLLTLGPGPWIIGGLVPTAYGCALLIREMREEKKKDEGAEEL